MNKLRDNFYGVVVSVFIIAVIGFVVGLMGMLGSTFIPFMAKMPFNQLFMVSIIGAFVSYVVAAIMDAEKEIEEC